MADFSVKRNASGYYDETPYKAVFKAPQPGEIWKTTMNKEFLIIATPNKGLYITIQLMELCKKDMIAVQSRDVKYTNPAMLSYVFESALAEFIKTVPDEQFDRIVECVSDALCIDLKINRADDTTLSDMQAVVDKQKAEIELLRQELDKERHNYDTAVWERDQYRQQNESMKADGNDGVYRQLYEQLIDRMLNASFKQQ